MNKTAAAITACIMFWIIACFFWPIVESFTAMIGAVVGFWIFIYAGIRIMYEVICGLTD